jgi:hypothetical protein
VIAVLDSLIDAYLAALAGRLPTTSSGRDIVSEARDHLLEAATEYEARGASRQAAERAALREFGSIDELAAEFRTVVAVRDAQRQAAWQLVTTGFLAVCGFSAFRLIPVWRGELADLMPPPLVASLAAVTLLWPSVVLFVLSRTSVVWTKPAWTARLLAARSLAMCLFGLGLPLCAGMVADQVTTLVSAPRMWLIVGALGGCLTAGRLVQVTRGGWATWRALQDPAAH